jgi:hypothetical protein
MTYDGLAVPLHGGYTAYASDGTTSFLVVSSDGVPDFTFASTAADNHMSLTVADSGTYASGYGQGYYVSYTSTGVKSGSAQINAIAIDFYLGGTPGVECGGIYIYVDNSGTGVYTNSNIWGLIINMEDIGSAPTHYGGIKIYRNVTNQGSTVDSFMYFYDSGTGVTDSLFVHQGSNQPQYFLKTLSAAPSSGMEAATVITSGDSTKALQCSLNSTIYFIPLHAATS